MSYWQADHCALSFFPWSSDASLAGLGLKFSPTWTAQNHVPPQLYSLNGISMIASAIDEPLQTENSTLKPYHFGNTKVKMEIDP